MVNSDESPMHLAKLLGLRNSLTNKTNDFVFNLVSKLPQTMNVEYVLKDCVKFLSPNIRKAVLLKLLSTKKLSMRLERDDEDMKLFMIPALALLLETDSNVEVLDLTGYVSHCPRTRRYVLLELAINYVSARATNLLSLSILKEGCFRENMPGMQVFNRNYMQAFVKLEHLQVLRIEEFEIDVQDLMWLCEKLRHLRFVSVNISEHYFNIPTLEELRDSFQFLKAFFFRSTASVQHILEFRNLCKMYLPNLQVIMGFASDFCSQREYQYAPHMKKERNLRHLGLNFQYEKADKDVHFMFPRVTHLMIEGPDKFSNNEWQIKPLLKFSISEIESLHLSHVPPEIVLQFVTTYGPNLHSLFLGNSICLKDSESSLDRIFELCPKLERVGLVDVKGPVIPMSCFTMLKEVIL
ncbi:Hypothetical predicted protein [Cloeon dipterum]|nr:Hypothetical predicted protein [Cloeon dipterum]